MGLLGERIGGQCLVEQIEIGVDEKRQKKEKNEPVSFGIYLSTRQIPVRDSKNTK